MIVSWHRFGVASDMLAVSKGTGHSATMRRPYYRRRSYPNPTRARISRWLRLMGTVLMMAALVVAAAYMNNKDTRTIMADGGKTVHVVDGDSFEIRNQDGSVWRVRLYGLDAPEYRQQCRDAAGSAWACGKAARASMMALLAGNGLRCDLSATDKYGRQIGTCGNARHPDVSAAQVAAGFAIATGGWGIPPYDSEQEQAKSAKRGIWAGSFDEPAVWRDMHKLAEATTGSDQAAVGVMEPPRSAKKP